MPNSHLLDILSDWMQWPAICQAQPSLKELTPLSEGLTNENWLFQPKDSQALYVIRCNSSQESDFYINRHHEREVHQSISELGLCPAVIFENKEKHYWIRPYINGNTLKETLSDNNSVSLLKQVTQVLKQVHELPINQHWPTIDLNERIESYWQQLISKQPEQAKEIESLKTTIKRQFKISNDFTPCLCHMDCNIQNWIINQNDVHLIDWEYAHIGNPAWDLAVLSESAQLNKTQIKAMLKQYASVSIAQLNQAKQEMQYLESLWFAIKLNLTLAEFSTTLNSIWSINKS